MYHTNCPSTQHNIHLAAPHPYRWYLMSIRVLVQPHHENFVHEIRLFHRRHEELAGTCKMLHWMERRRDNNLPCPHQSVLSTLKKYIQRDWLFGEWITLWVPRSSMDHTRKGGTKESKGKNEENVQLHRVRVTIRLSKPRHIKWSYSDGTFFF